ncbi:MAG: cysteine--tRNA ligase [bacterium]|nr:cysteine--tRNA ligase [bacterium]
MALTIYNTLTGRKEPFEPMEPGRVRMYVCGITAYGLCHIGHARALVAFDMIVRYLRYLGYDVTYVRNFTDVDDKIIERAQTEGVSYRVVADRYIEAFYRDFDRLGLLRPDVEPKASDYIDGMIVMIERLIERGYAYAVEGDVFYSVAKFPTYGRLSGKRIEDLEAGARVEVHESKRDPLDFALWKASKEGEPSWPSPWGEGRPGWHIECSVMSGHHLGETFDIHGGGRDLQFPHHDNEIAQSEAATGKPFVRYWIHNGFINIDQAKMSKSLGNILNVEDILKVHHPEVIWLFLLSHHYRSPIDYTEQALSDAKKNLDYFYTTQERCEELVGEDDLEAEAPRPAQAHPAWEEVAGMEAAFRGAMDDDFNSALALGNLFRAAGAVNTFLDSGAEVGEKAALAAAYLSEVQRVGAVLGILGESPSAYFRRGVEGLDAEAIEAHVAEREAARRAKDWERADAIRDDLARRGVILEDRPDGTTVWKVRT